MRKTVFIVFGLAITAILSGTVVSPSFARHAQQVLGAKSTSSQLNFPPVTSGAGFILPDSPFYILDQAFQTARTATAFTSSKKARIHGLIAGERLAELRIMFSRNNEHGINTALSHLSEEMKASAQALSEAAASGEETSELAKELNDAVKMQRHILGALVGQANGSLNLKLKAVRKSLKESKVEIEDRLTVADLENAIRDDLNEEVEEEFEDSQDVVEELERDLEELNRQLGEASRRSLNRREEALKSAIEQRNESLEKAEKRLLEAEKNKQDKLLKLRLEAAQQVRLTVKNAQEAAKRYQQAKTAVEEASKEPIE